VGIPACPPATTRFSGFIDESLLSSGNTGFSRAPDGSKGVGVGIVPGYKEPGLVSPGIPGVSALQDAVNATIIAIITIIFTFVNEITSFLRGVTHFISGGMVHWLIPECKISVYSG
jgi:hypothetical protein